MINPVWSATTCDFPGAGVYLGLAPRFEHLIVARRLTPRQVRMFTGATVGVGKGASPLDYYAVRDPSVVRVIPLNQPHLPNGFRHVKLAFQIDRRQFPEDAVTLSRQSGASAPGAGETPVAFLMTIGLAMAQEDAFYKQAVGAWPDHEFADLYTRISQMAGRP